MQKFMSFLVVGLLLLFAMPATGGECTARCGPEERTDPLTGKKVLVCNTGLEEGEGDGRGCYYDVETKDLPGGGVEFTPVCKVIAGECDNNGFWLFPVA